MYVCVYVCLVSVGICVSLYMYACLYMYEFMSMCLCCMYVRMFVMCGCVYILSMSVCMYERVPWCVCIFMYAGEWVYDVCRVPGEPHSRRYLSFAEISNRFQDVVCGGAEVRGQERKAVSAGDVGGWVA